MPDELTTPNKPSPLPEEVLTALKQHFITNKGVIARHGKKPAYYNESYGLKVKEIVDNILINKKSIKILASEGVSVYSLRQQWYEGKRYLRQYLDKDSYYANALENIKCRTEFDYVEIIPRFTLRAALLTAPTAVISPWKDELVAWLNREDIKLEEMFKRSNVLLSPSDIAWCHEQLIGVEKLFLAKFETNEVMIVRYDN